MTPEASPRQSSQPTHAERLAAVRLVGGVKLRLAPGPRGTHARLSEERGGFRVRFPKVGGACEAVLINVGGGIAGGDRISFEIDADAGAVASLTTPAAERVYRTLGPPAQVHTRLVIGPGAQVSWLPQETILYDRAGLTRRIDVEMADDATLLMAEMLVFGRTASGETVRNGALRDDWRVHRDGCLIFAEAVRLEDTIAPRMRRRAVADGAHVTATVLYVAPGAQDRLDAARVALEPYPFAAASAWNGLLCARILSHDAAAARRAVVAIASMLSCAPLPRAWS